jgi:mannose-6-phosphate isomerase-like protein (cupin superfamily)
MENRTLDLRKVFGMVVTYNDKQELISPEKPFEVITELYPGGQSAVHVHPQQDEVYEVKEGEMQVFMDGTWKPLKAGERVSIPKGTIHAFRNAGSQKAVAFNSHHPGLRFGEMLERIQQHINEGKITSTKGFKNLAYMSSIMVEYNDVMKTIKPPPALIRIVSTLGKLFGYKLNNNR